MDTRVDTSYRVAAARYWRRSNEWRGSVPYTLTTGELINRINRAKDLSYNYPLILDRVLRLMQEVILRKRCRKTKPTNNVVPLVKIEGTTTGRWPCTNPSCSNEPRGAKHG